VIDDEAECGGGELCVLLMDQTISFVTSYWLPENPAVYDQTTVGSQADP
jgi:hypothetical protein